MGRSFASDPSTSKPGAFLENKLILNSPNPAELLSKPLYKFLAYPEAHRFFLFQSSNRWLYLDEMCRRPLCIIACNCLPVSSAYSENPRLSPPESVVLLDSLESVCGMPSRIGVHKPSEGIFRRLLFIHRGILSSHWMSFRTILTVCLLSCFLDLVSST